MKRAVDRLAAERGKVEAYCADPPKAEADVLALEQSLSTVSNQLSNFGDARPVSFVAFAPGSHMCATGSWSSLVKLWSIPDCTNVATLRGHTERISGLAWHPHAQSQQLATAANLVTAGCDGVAKL